MLELQHKNKRNRTNHSLLTKLLSVLNVEEIKYSFTFYFY